MISVQRVEFESSRGQRLVGLLHRPDRSTTGAGVVVAHGLLSSKDAEKHRLICEGIAARGHLALRFDFQGRGESRSGATDLSFTADVADLHRALVWLRGQGATHLALVGSSMGGAASLQVSLQEPDIAALITAAAPAYLHNRPDKTWTSNWFQRLGDMGRLEVQPGLFVPPGLFDELKGYDLLSTAAQVRVPWLILHGAFDELIPLADAHAFAAANPAAQLQIHPEADHRFSRPEWREWLAQQVCDFLAPHL